MIVDRPQFPGLSPQDAAQPQRISQVVNLLMGGKSNNVIDFDVPSGSTSPVTIADLRINSTSWVMCMDPRTVVSAVRDGEVDIAWTGAEPSFIRLLVVG